jgi:hypothetical protein
MDPFAFLNESINKMPSVGRATLEAIPSYEEAVQMGVDFLPFPLNLLHNNALNKSAVPDVGASQGFVTPNASAKYYAGEKYGYQSPESYKEIFGGYPRSYREIQKAQLDETAKQQAKEEQTKEQNELEDLVLGAQKDGKFYAGKDYGYQSAPSYKVVRGAFPTGYIEPGKKSPTVLNTPASKGSESTSITGQTKNPPMLPPELLELTREGRLAVATEKAKDFERQQQILALYERGSLEKSRLNTQRQVELENIKAWRDISQTQIEAQTRSAALTASLMTALQQPNVNFMGEISNAFNAGAAPFSARVRTRA